MGLLGYLLAHFFLDHYSIFIFPRLEFRAASEFLLFLFPLLLIAYAFTSPLSQRTPPLRRIHELLRDSAVGRFIQEGSALQFFILSLAAGWGEEILFRGFLQVKFGIALAALIFGVCHAVTFPFFLIATGMGFYLGFSFQHSEQNILVPVLLHAAYDFVALLFYRRLFRLPAPTNLI